jgi:hypothetical protein
LRTYGRSNINWRDIYGTKFLFIARKLFKGRREKVAQVIKKYNLRVLIVKIFSSISCPSSFLIRRVGLFIKPAFIFLAFLVLVEPLSSVDLVVHLHETYVRHTLHVMDSLLALSCSRTPASSLEHTVPIPRRTPTSTHSL